jgi:hypothetical protein
LSTLGKYATAVPLELTMRTGGGKASVDDDGWASAASEGPAALDGPASELEPGVDVGFADERSSGGGEPGGDGGGEDGGDEGGEPGGRPHMPSIHPLSVLKVIGGDGSYGKGPSISAKATSMSSRVSAEARRGPAQGLRSQKCRGG